MNAVDRPPYIGKLFVIPERTVSEANARDHWAKRANRVKRQRTAAYYRFFGARGAVSLPVVVTLTRIAPSNGLDDDNLRGALKAVRDGVADALGVDDRDPRVTWCYDQRRGPWGVEVRVEPANSESAYGVEERDSRAPVVWAKCHGAHRALRIEKPHRDIDKTDEGWLRRRIRNLVFFAD